MHVVGNIMKPKHILIAVFISIAIIIFLFFLHFRSNSTAPSLLKIGNAAPNTDFFLSNNQVQSISNYSGKPVLVYFVATWCSSCSQGTKALADNASFFSNKGIKIIELELYNNLNFSGPSINSFINFSISNKSKSELIIPGYASYNMSKIYDPKAYLDLYYLIAPNGTIIYINGSPQATMNLIKIAANKI